MLANKQPVLSLDEKADLTRILNTKYAAFLDGRTFQITITSDSYLVQVTLCLSDAAERFYYPVHGRVSCKEYNLTEREAVMLLLDYMDCYFDEFFKERGELYLTIDWSKHTFESVEFQLKGQIQDLEKERLAEAYMQNPSV